MYSSQNISNGLIIYAGIDEYEKEHFTFITPIIKVDTFYYNCSNKFNTDISTRYLQNHNGYIIFANGNECIIYEFNGGVFNQKRRFDALLQKRQKKGGSSSNRIARRAEETRHMYITKVIDYLNIEYNKNNSNNITNNCNAVLFGSKEITKMILTSSTLLLSVRYGGMLEFDKNTICDTRRWISYLDENVELNNTIQYNKYYEEVLNCLDNPEKVDKLDFDINNMSNMKFYIYNEVLNDGENNKNTGSIKIPFPKRSHTPLIYYERLYMFEYIGVKYYADTNITD